MLPVHPRRIGHGLARLYAHQNFVRAGIVAGQIMRIIGRDQGDAGLRRQPVDLRRHALVRVHAVVLNFFLEIQDHGMDADKRVTPQVNRLSAETGIPLVATNDAHYLTRDDARAHEILMCIQTGKTMSDPARMHWEHPDFYLKSRAEMLELFGEVEEALDRTWEIAERCQVKLEKSKEPFPRFEVPG